MGTTTEKTVTRLAELRLREDEILAEIAGITQQVARYATRVEQLGLTLRTVRQEMRERVAQSTQGAAA